jgi:hypothetical protein
MQSQFELSTRGWGIWISYSDASPLREMHAHHFGKCILLMVGLALGSPAQIIEFLDPPRVTTSTCDRVFPFEKCLTPQLQTDISLPTTDLGYEHP